MNQETFPNNLTRLNNKQLINAIEDLSQNERSELLTFLKHLNEIERRGIYMVMGHSSMFDFCRTHLKLSESETAKRIRSCRCIRKYPMLEPLLASGEINITTLAIAARVITPSNCLNLIERIKNKSTREVDAIVLSFAAPQTYQQLRDRVRIVRPKHKQSPVAEISLFEKNIGSDKQLLKNQNQFTDRAISNSTSPLASGDTRDSLFPSNTKEAADQVPETKSQLTPSHDTGTNIFYEIRLCAGPEFLDKVEKLKVLLSGKYPQGPSLEVIFNEGMDSLINKLSPAQREAARVKKKLKQSKPVDTSKTTNTSYNNKANLYRKKGKRRSRYISQKLRDTIYLRDQGRCTYTSPNGERCSSRHDLEIHHDLAYARGGGTSLKNLRLLCRAHNVFLAEQEFNHPQYQAELDQLTTKGSQLNQTSPLGP